MIPLPPISASSGAAGGTAGGAGAWTTGDWNINIAGSAPSMQAGGPSLLMIAAIGVVAWLLLKK